MSRRRDTPLIERVALIVSLVSLIVSVIAFYTVQDVRINKTISDLNFCPTVMSGSSCGFDETSVCGDTVLFHGHCEKGGNLLVEAEIFNKGLALATNVVLNVRFNGGKLNLTQNSCTYGLVTTYEAGVEKQNSVLCNETYGIRTRWGIHIIKPQESSKILFDYSAEMFIEKPSEIIFDLYENGELVKEKTYSMRYQ